MIKIERYRLHESAEELGLEEMALSRLDGYRWQAAQHPSLPLWLMKRLAQDPKAHVRFQLAINPSTPVEILLMLAQDSAPLVAEQATLHPNWPEDLTSWALGDEWIDK